MAMKHWFGTKIVLLIVFGIFLLNEAVFCAAKPVAEGPASPAVHPDVAAAAAQRMADQETKSEVREGSEGEITPEEQELLENIRILFSQPKHTVGEEGQELKVAIPNPAIEKELTSYFDKAVKGKFARAFKAILAGKPDDEQVTSMIASILFRNIDSLLRKEDKRERMNTDLLFILSMIKDAPQNPNFNFVSMITTSTFPAGNTYLHQMAAQCSGDVVKQIIDLAHLCFLGIREFISGHINRQNNKKQTALHSAIIAGNASAATTLLADRDIDRTMQDEDGKIARDYNPELYDKCLAEVDIQIKIKADRLRGVTSLLGNVTGQSAEGVISPDIAKIVDLYGLEQYASETRTAMPTYEGDEGPCDDPNCPNCAAIKKEEQGE